MSISVLAYLNKFLNYSSKNKINVLKILNYNINTDTSYYYHLSSVTLNLCW